VVNREGASLGKVDRMIDNTAQSVLCVVEPAAESASDAKPVERLIPFVAAFIDAVDLDARQIRVDWGLDY
jgi:16S rRNA processing protein RimM